jgi:anti-sigma factor RsiW
MSDGVGMSAHPSHDDLAAFALGALDGREERSVARHLDRCDRCAAELSDRLLPAVAVLGESVDQLEAPETLRQGVMATVHQEARSPGPEPEEPGADAAARSRPSGLRALLLRPAAGLAALALVAAAVGGYVVADGGEDPTETIPLSESAEGVGGSLVVDSGSATLHMHGMGQLPEGDVYQVWVADAAGVQPSAAFVPHADGTATAAVPEAAGEVSEVMITHEPRAGREQPTLERTVFDAKL